ncbi:MAG: acetyl-CoA carboxylase biotin carboxyl carrier protein [Planctomycetales bacterium]|jgi:acetyl-CoA carboxylase biotin carboxyl carrier protein|nr:acetyl-CoA carboxylase biotin carboxyl carrier protein [Planctomycetales bacterium]
MAKSVENEEKGESFDLDKFRKLLQLMEKFDVSEVNLQNEEESWKIRRGPRYAAPTFTQGFAPAPMMQAAPVAAPAAASAPVAAAAAPAAPVGITINAPAVGTFYTAASPEDPPFVSVGSVVKADTVICIIEAMKVFNQIQAEKSGRILEILVENGDAVGFNQPLFRIEPL